MRALITNDDGISSTGIRTLAEVALKAGLEVLVAAPAEERRCYGTALSALEQGGRMVVDDHPLEGLDLAGSLAVQASPAMIVFVAARGAFGEPPDIVLSGVNHGPNTGQAVLHSGTVGAALTASSLGVPAMAISLAAPDPTEWSTATEVAGTALDWYLGSGLADAAPYVLNVNVPNVPPERLRGIRAASLASFGAVQAEIGERGSGYVTMTFTQIEDGGEDGTDVALLRNGWATATPLRAPSTVPTVDLSTLR